MKAMLLAAGLGTRLRPLTNTIPKPLIPINGIPLIFYNLALLKKYGIHDVVINLHYLGNQIRDLLGDGRRLGFRFRYSFEKKILGTGGGIKKAERFLKNGPFLVLNGDIIADVNLKKMMELHRKQKPMATLFLRPLKKEKFGKIRVRGEKIVSILKGGATFFAGIHLIESRFLKTQKRGVKTCVIRDGYVPLLKAGEPFAAFLHARGFWNDLGTPKRVRETEKRLARTPLSYQKELSFLSGKLTHRP
ncbi:MAG: NDP-sugar synthase [Deltaproteobacteria bacterium]|nr:NDP-sugar synthase [Deltaproteobacteria bacterium]